MFFYVSKIIWAILSPLNLIFLILMMGVIIGAFSKALGRSIMVLGMLMLVTFGIFPVGPNLLAGLEQKYTAPDSLPEDVTGILVLGGSVSTGLSSHRSMPILNDNAERITEAMTLAKQYPQAIILFSGGNGSLQGGKETEAEITELFLNRIGFDTGNVFYEDESRNTYENLKYSKELMLPQPGESWLLVTSAYHMPRALAVAREQGWENIMPYPVDFRTRGEAKWMPVKFDVLGNMYHLHVAVREYIGIFAYHMTGKISLPLSQ